MKNLKTSGLFLLLIGTMLALIACSSLPPEAKPNTAQIPVAEPQSDGIPLTSTPIVIDPSVVEPAESASEADAAVSSQTISDDVSEDDAPSSAVDGDTYNNLPVGFLETGHPYIGDLDAPVVIQEYSDYQCPFCSRFAENTMSEIKANAIANGEAVLIFYDYPLDFHPQAAAAANAARCAGFTAGAASYWAMHDALFADVGSWSISDPNPVFISMGETLGLGDEFAVCVGENRYADAIQADFQDGLSRGVTGTPSFFLNGELLVGAQPIQVFDQAIAAMADGGSLPQEPAQAAPSPQDVEIPPFSMPDQVVLDENYAAIMGDPDAPILIVEFTDYQCPFCGRHSAETMPIIVQNMVDTGRARYALKDFPLDSIHPMAREGAVAARCAGEQDFYWEMHDQLFVQQAAWGQGGITAEAVQDVFVGFAQSLGLDTAAFEVCLTDGRYDQLIEANYQEGLAQQVSGTPAFFLDGYFISGAQPFEVFDLVITNVEEGTIETLFREAYDEQVARYKEQLAQQQVQQQAPPAPPSGPVEVSIEGDPFIGDPNAPVTIIEFTDFQCPFCARHHENAYPFLVSNYVDTGFVKYVFKQFPLSFHPEADEASEAARCADDQGEYLAMHNMLFSKQQEWSGNPNFMTLFVEYATDLSLDTDTFAECLNSGKYTSLVQAQLQEGFELGVSGTPTFFINGNIFVGAQPIQAFAQAIESFK